MIVTELDSFIKKFHQLWSAGVSAHLDLDTHAGRAWVGLRVQLGHAPGLLQHNLHPPFTKPFQKGDSPSRLRRRVRREAARKAKAEEATNKENADQKVTEDAKKVDSNEENTSHENDRNQSADHSDQNDKTLTVTAEEATSQAMRIADELCPDKEFEVATLLEEPKSICSVDFYPMEYKLDGLEEFRGKIEEYFEKRTDVIKRVIKCEVVNFGNNVNLVVEVKVKRGWIFFFGDPEENYADLEGVRTIRHSCKDLGNCDKG